MFIINYIFIITVVIVINTVSKEMNHCWSCCLHLYCCYLYLICYWKDHSIEYFDIGSEMMHRTRVHVSRYAFHLSWNYPLQLHRETVLWWKMKMQNLVMDTARQCCNSNANDCAEDRSLTHHPHLYLKDEYDLKCENGLHRWNTVVDKEEMVPLQEQRDHSCWDMLRPQPQQPLMYHLWRNTDDSREVRQNMMRD